MDEVYDDLLHFFKKPAILETFVDILLCAVPIWVAVMIGLVIGWSWRPRWTGIIFLGLRSKFRFLWTAPPGFGARRLWFAFTALSAFSLCGRLWANFKGKAHESRVENSDDEILSEGNAGVSGSSEKEEDIVTKNDLEHLLNHLEGNTNNGAWQSMMERSTPNMAYQAWCHQPETGPTIYRSRTVFEDATPELVRDFFWDDDFRSKWDPMLAHFKVLEEFPLTGTMIVHWIKKFPFFCSDREYIFGRRTWESARTYYCVTKAVPYAPLPKRDKPKRVDPYFSSWRIRAVESCKGDGQLSACEVSLIHYEDMGIPKDVAKVGVHHGMWGAVKKLNSGVRAYQSARKSEASPSRMALMARITTRIPVNVSDALEAVSDAEGRNQLIDLQKLDQGGHWKWFIVGGTVALVCGLHTVVFGKALLFGAARKLARQ